MMNEGDPGGRFCLMKDRARTWFLVSALYSLLAFATIRLTSNGQDITPVWPANAVLLAFLLRGKTPDWLGILSAGFLANIVANAFTRGSISGAVLFGSCNVLEAAIAASLLRPAIGTTDLLGTPQVVGRFVLVAGIVAPCVSGMGGAATAWLISGEDLFRSFGVWVVGDGLGLLIFTPFLISVINGEYRRDFREKGWKDRGEILALSAFTTGISSLVFFLGRAPLLFLLFGPVMLATFRQGGLGAKISVMLIAVTGAVATLWNGGPIAAYTVDHVEQAQWFQLFLAVLLLTCLPVAAEVSARAALTVRLAESERSLMEREAKLSQIAATDSLTDLLNRAAFREQTEAALARCGDEPLCLVAMDLDDFKAVNDQWGHQAGDAALTHLATVLRLHAGETDLIGRPGGDEFMLLLPDTDLPTAKGVTKRIRDALTRMSVRLPDGTELHLSMSFGIAQWSPDLTFDELVRQADVALYGAKARGRAARAQSDRLSQSA